MKNSIKLIFAGLLITAFSACEKDDVTTVTQNQVISEEILPETPVIEALWIDEIIHPNGNARIRCRVPGKNCKRGGGEVSKIVTSNVIDDSPEQTVVVVTYDDPEEVTDTLYIEK